MWTDLRYAWRQIRKAPAFAGVVIALIGIGIAANALIFTLVDALLLRPLPVRHPEELVRLVDQHPPLPDTSAFEYGYWKFLRAHSTSFSEVMGDANWTTTSAVGGDIEFVTVDLVTENYFAALGVNAALPAVDSVVLSDHYWRRKLNADPGAVGRVILLNGRPFTVTGIAPPEFRGTTVELNPDVRVQSKAALSLIEVPPARAHDEGFFPYEIVARLKPGVTAERALAESNSLYQDWARESGTRDQLDGRLRLQSIERGVSVLRDQFSSALTLLMAGVGVVLLMVCLNVAGLLLERATARERETAVRLAVGASRGRLMRQWLTESLALAGLGGVLGVALAWAAMPVMASWIPPLRNRAGELLRIDPHLHLNGRVLLFSFVACVGAAVLAGLAPALRAGRYDLGLSLRTTRSSSRVEGGITVFQIALCTLLLIEAGLFARTLSAMRTKDLGFDRDHVVAFTLRPEHARMGGNPAGFGHQLVEQARALPGVEAASFAELGLLRGTGMKTTVGLPGAKAPPSEFMNSSLNMVSPEYFDTMGIRIIEGRALQSNDPHGDEGVRPVVVNQALVRRFFAGQDPIGKLFGTGSGVLKADYQIVGVATDAQYRSLREGIPPTFYTNAGYEPNILHLRAAGDPSSLILPVRELVRRLAPGWSVKEINLLRDEAERSIWRERLVAQLAIGFACVAVLLAAIGLYGTLAYYVARNRRGIGIRMAIGAARADVVRLLAGRVGRLLLVGGLLGLIAAFALGETVRALLFGIAPADPMAMVVAVVCVVLMAGAALGLPAWRATRIDPAVALRDE